MGILQNVGRHKILAIMHGQAMENSLKLIELAGRTAYQSRGRISDSSAERFVEMLRERGHESVLEHSAMTVEFNNVSRGFTHELVRHRLASYTQESTRYVDESDFLVVVPPDKDPDEKVIKIEISKRIEKDFPGAACQVQRFRLSFKEWMEINEQAYRSLRKAGWPPQDARQVLPIGTKAQIVVTANFREWRHILKLRTALSAHWEIRRVMTNLLKDVQRRVPVMFDDFVISPDGKSAKLT